MASIVSPLPRPMAGSIVKSWSGGSGPDYSANGFSPAFVADESLAAPYYRVAGSDATYDDVYTSDTGGASGATMVNAAGSVVHRPHNLFVNSEVPATQGVTVASGVQYTVEMQGTGSVALTGAGTGTATDGSPASITASTTTLTCTVSGSPTRVWVYRSDLGGMADVLPDQRTSGAPANYVVTGGSAVYLLRRGHHRWNGSAWVPTCLHEPVAATNTLLSSGTLSTQNVTVTAQAYTLHFTGTGTVTLSGASTAGPLVGTGSGEQNRVSLTFTPTAGTLTLTVSGTVTNAQLEAGSVPSSYIPTNGAAVTRAADTRFYASAALPAGDADQTIVAKGRWSFDASTGLTFFQRAPTSESNYLWLRSAGGTLAQGYLAGIGGISGAANAAMGTSPPVSLAPLNLALRVDSGAAIQVAVDGAAGAEVATTVVAAVAGDNLAVGTRGNGTSSAMNNETDVVLMFGADIAEAGIEEATA